MCFLVTLLTVWGERMLIRLGICALSSKMSFPPNFHCHVTQTSSKCFLNAIFVVSPTRRPYLLPWILHEALESLGAAAYLFTSKLFSSSLKLIYSITSVGAHIVTVRRFCLCRFNQQSPLALTCTNFGLLLHGPTNGSLTVKVRGGALRLSGKSALPVDSTSSSLPIDVFHVEPAVMSLLRCFCCHWRCALLPAEQDVCCFWFFALLTAARYPVVTQTGQPSIMTGSSIH